MSDEAREAREATREAESSLIAPLGLSCMAVVQGVIWLALGWVVYTCRGGGARAASVSNFRREEVT